MAIDLGELPPALLRQRASMTSLKSEDITYCFEYGRRYHDDKESEKPPSRVVISTHTDGYSQLRAPQ